MEPKRKRQSLSIASKHELIAKYEEGMRISRVAKLFKLSPSTVLGVLKQKEELKRFNPAFGLKVMSKLRSVHHDKMETLLLMWVMQQQQQGETLRSKIICDKAIEIYDNLDKQNPCEHPFKASHGWLDNFKRRANIYPVPGQGTVVKVSEECMQAFSKLIEAKGYDPQQGFECVNENVEDLTTAWRKIWPETDIPEHSSVGVDPAKVDKAAKIDKEGGAKEQPKALPNDPLHVSVAVPKKSAEKRMDEDIPTKVIEEMLEKWDQVNAFVQKYHPEKLATSYASELYNDTCVMHFRNILNRRKKHMENLVKHKAGEGKKKGVLLKNKSKK